MIGCPCLAAHPDTPSLPLRSVMGKKEGEKAVSGDKDLEITYQLPSQGIMLDLGKANVVYNRGGWRETKEKS